MSQENVETVRSGYEQFRANGYFDAQPFAPDFVWDRSKFLAWPEQQFYYGIDGAE